jgi:hypothetical protein
MRQVAVPATSRSTSGDCLGIGRIAQASESYTSPYTAESWQLLEFAMIDLGQHHRALAMLFRKSMVENADWMPQ